MEERRNKITQLLVEIEEPDYKAFELQQDELLSFAANLPSIKKIHVVVSDASATCQNKLTSNNMTKIQVSDDDHLFNHADGSYIRLTAAGGINYIQPVSTKNTLRFSPCYSTTNILELAPTGITIGDYSRGDNTNLNIYGSISINNKQVVSSQLGAIADDLPLEEKIAAILRALRTHGLISSS